ncbi:UNVERIFIED_CONTAM: hypothetical protein Sradi_5090200 [Sesamum radiatum]|uniref:Reverse transcriptase domain-containing protein n=1 Tax=Sesamum radiatum TaxID=300843 RepID=A0AAW2M319_SESRA
MPKLNNPEFVTQFRPISLCNVVIKLASKCVANSMKGIMHSIVSPTQSAFIPGRLITDNVLLAFELNHYLKASSRSNNASVALKLDMSKAYDRVDWPFLRCIILKLGFESWFVHLIMLLVTTVSYSLTLDGEHFGYFHPKCGIHQGDPLSPYLFIFVAEAFSCILQEAERRGMGQGVAVCAAASKYHIYCSPMILYCSVKQRESRLKRSNAFLLFMSVLRASGQFCKI